MGEDREQRLALSFRLRSSWPISHSLTTAASREKAPQSGAKTARFLGGYSLDKRKTSSSCPRSSKKRLTNSVAVAVTSTKPWTSE
jgi:hypothetical protein